MRLRSRLSSLRSSTSASAARELRSTMTDAEIRIWYHLRARRFMGFKFRRQVPLGRYVVDFSASKRGSSSSSMAGSMPSAPWRTWKGRVGWKREGIE